METKLLKKQKQYIQLKLGSFVKLNKSEVKSALKENQVKRLRTTPVKTSIQKKIYCNHPGSNNSGNAVENSRSKTKNKTKSLWVDKDLRSILKFVRPKKSEDYELVSDISASGLDSQEKRVTTKRCSIVIETLPTTNMVSFIDSSVWMPMPLYFVYVKLFFGSNWHA